MAMLHSMDLTSLLQRGAVPAVTTGPSNPAGAFCPGSGTSCSNTNGLLAPSSFVLPPGAVTQQSAGRQNYNLVILTDAQLQQLLDRHMQNPAPQQLISQQLPKPLPVELHTTCSTNKTAEPCAAPKVTSSNNHDSMARLLAAVEMVQEEDRNSQGGSKRPCASLEGNGTAMSKRPRVTNDAPILPSHCNVSPAGSASSSPARAIEQGPVVEPVQPTWTNYSQIQMAALEPAAQPAYWSTGNQSSMVVVQANSSGCGVPRPQEVTVARTSGSDDESACSIQTGMIRVSPVLQQQQPVRQSTIQDSSSRPVMCTIPAGSTMLGNQVVMQFMPQNVQHNLQPRVQLQQPAPVYGRNTSQPALTLADVMRGIQQQQHALSQLGAMQTTVPSPLPLSLHHQVPLPSMAALPHQPTMSVNNSALHSKRQPMSSVHQSCIRGGVNMNEPNVVFSVPQPINNRDIEAALAEVLEVMLHKPKGRPVKYIDLGVNRMALKYHVGVKLSGRVESMGATDTELAAHMLLDMVRIGLGLYSEAASAAKPSPEAHPEEQSTSTLQYHPSQYSTCFVQRVVAQLINRNLVATSELLHAYTRAHMAGCRPGPCFMSVSQALTIL